MDACGREFASRFKTIGATKVLTAEISGIAPALTTALHLGLPVVYARKHKPITMPDQVLLTLSGVASLFILLIEVTELIEGLPRYSRSPSSAGERSA
jgi:hypothetical protein